MKKILNIFLILALFLLTACSGNTQLFREDVSCKDIMNAAVDATNKPTADKIYLKDDNNLDASTFSLWADGLFGESEEFSLIDDYAVYVSAGTTTYEVAVLKATDSTGVETIKSIMERRKETLSLGDKGMYDPMFKQRMSNAKIETVGDFVILIITDDNNAALKALENLK